MKQHKHTSYIQNITIVLQYDSVSISQIWHSFRSFLFERGFRARSCVNFRTPLTPSPQIQCTTTKAPAGEHDVELRLDSGVRLSSGPYVVVPNPDPLPVQHNSSILSGGNDHFLYLHPSLLVLSLNKLHPFLLFITVINQHVH